MTGRTLTGYGNNHTFDFRDDVVYEIQGGSLAATSDDTIRTLNSIPQGAPPDGSYYLQFQLGNNVIAMNAYGMFASDGNDDLYRYILLGDTSYSKKQKLTKAEIKSTGFIQKSDKNPDVFFGHLYDHPGNWIFSLTDNGTPPASIDIAAYDWGSGSGAKETGGGLAAIRAFGGGKYFFEGWQNNLFDTSLV